MGTRLKRWANISLSGCILRKEEYGVEEVESVEFCRTTFWKVVFKNTTFSKCNFSYATFESCVFIACKFLNCELKGVMFKKCSLQSCVIKPLAIHTKSAFEIDNCAIKMCDITDASIDRSGGGILLVEPLLSPVIRTNISARDPVSQLLFIAGKNGGSTSLIDANYVDRPPERMRSGATIYSAGRAHNTTPIRKTQAMAFYSDHDVFIKTTQ